MSEPRTAVYSTVFPGGERFLADWYRSILSQEDRGFDLWIGTDGLSPEAVDDAAGRHVEARWVAADRGDTPASLRRRAMAEMVRRYEVVVFVDSDDIALPGRVRQARRDTGPDAVSACALSLVDEHGRDLGRRMDAPRGADWGAILTRRNVLGLSNTAYGTDLLGRLVDFPDDCTLLDWHLATRSWLLGAPIRFHHEPLMLYRQYARNVARVVRPFSASQITEATRLVLRHYRQLPWTAGPGQPGQWSALRDAMGRAEAFAGRIRDGDTLARYVEALNRLDDTLLWWECVAHPGLEAQWST